MIYDDMRKKVAVAKKFARDLYSAREKLAEDENIHRCSGKQNNRHVEEFVERLPN